MKTNKGQYKKLKKQINRDLELPSWFNLVKWGIPYFFSIVASLTITLMLFGWVAMPIQTILTLAWVEALFLAMTFPVKTIAIGLVGFGAFLSTLVLSSLLVRAFLFSICEDRAIESVKLNRKLFEENKSLQKSIGLETLLNNQNKEQVEFLKGFAVGAKNSSNNNDYTEPSSEIDERPGEELELNAQQDEEARDPVNTSRRPEPLVFRPLDVGSRTPSLRRSPNSQKLYYVKLPVQH